MQHSPVRFTVAFDEADGEGIVFHGNYFRLAHRAFEAWLPQCGIAWHEWFKNPVFGVPLRHVEADFLSPLRPGDTFDVVITVQEIGRTSVHFNYEFRDASGKAAARLKSSHVFVSRKDMSKIEIPEDLRRRLQA